MPTYTYKCQKCGNINDVVQKITDDPLTTCDCGGPLNKVIHPAGIIFKGSGFYKTDYGTGSNSGTKEPSKETAPSCPSASSCPAACPANN